MFRIALVLLLLPLMTVGIAKAQTTTTTTTPQEPAPEDDDERGTGREGGDEDEAEKDSEDSDARTRRSDDRDDTGSERRGRDDTRGKRSAHATESVRTGGVFGMGPFVGNGIGLSARWWPKIRNAITLDIGSTFTVNSLQVSVVYQHGLLIVTPGKGASVIGSVGLGPRYALYYVGPGSDGTAQFYQEIGGRIPVGVSIVFAQLPIEIHIEAGPFVGAGLGATGGLAIGADGRVGARWYF